MTVSTYKNLFIRERIYVFLQCVLLIALCACPITGFGLCKRIQHLEVVLIHVCIKTDWVTPDFIETVACQKTFFTISLLVDEFAQIKETVFGNYARSPVINSFSKLLKHFLLSKVSSYWRSAIQCPFSLQHIPIYPSGV